MTTAPPGGASGRPPGGPADPAGQRHDWLVLTASERGASHVASRAPNQDAVATERAGIDGVVAAVADGHGHSRHLRSARGSRLAVKIGCQVAQELADSVEGNSAFFAPRDPASAPDAAAAELARLAEEFLVPAIVQRWREAVLADVKADPFTEAEQGMRHKGDDAVIAYGSTLLLAVALLGWLVLAQIGDGDVVGVRADGGSVQPVPADPQLDGLVTTSLCGADPQSDFRIAIVDTAAQPLLAVLLATDGYGNAQVVEEWPAAFSQDLAWMLRDRDVNWLASQLPSWAARCASPDGSADDTTVALLVSSVVAAPRTAQDAAEADSGSEDTTIPAVAHADTEPAQIPDPDASEHHEAREPVTLRQLAHRTAPEPVILERSATVQADIPADPPAGSQPAADGGAGREQAGQEPPTTEIPRLQAGLDPPGQDGHGRARHDRDGAEPPTTRWRLRGRDER